MFKLPTKVIRCIYAIIGSIFLPLGHAFPDYLTSLQILQSLNLDNADDVVGSGIEKIEFCSNRNDGPCVLFVGSYKNCVACPKCGSNREKSSTSYFLDLGLKRQLRSLYQNPEVVSILKHPGSILRHHEAS